MLRSRQSETRQTSSQSFSYNSVPKYSALQFLWNCFSTSTTNFPTWSDLQPVYFIRYVKVFNASLLIIALSFKFLFIQWDFKGFNWHKAFYKFKKYQTSILLRTQTERKIHKICDFSWSVSVLACQQALWGALAAGPKERAKSLLARRFWTTDANRKWSLFLRPLSQNTKIALSQSLILEPLVKATFRKRPRPLFGLTVFEFSIVFNLLLNSEVHCKIGQKLKEFIIWLSLLPTHLLLC